MHQIFQWLSNHPLTGIIAFTGLIQIIPIKINPWSALIKWIGNNLNKGLNEKIDSISRAVLSTEKEIDENEKDRIRWEILDFANTCRNGIKHTKDEFQHIITLNDKYKRLLAKTHDVNGVFDSEYAYIQELYTERQKKNDFL